MWFWALLFWLILNYILLHLQYAYLRPHNSKYLMHVALIICALDSRANYCEVLEHTSRICSTLIRISAAHRTLTVEA